MKTNETKNVQGRTTPEKRLVGERFSFSLIFEMKDGANKPWDAKEADFDMVGQIDSIVSATLNELKYSGNNANGWLHVHIESNFAAGFIPMGLRTEVSNALELAVRKSFSDGPVQKWELPSDGSIIFKFNLNYLINHGTIPENRSPDGNELEKGPPEEPNEDADRPAYLATLLARIPQRAAFEEVASALSEANHDVRMEIAARLEPALNEKLRDGSFPQGTLEQKKAICDFVERALEPLGLAVRVPNTPGLPGKLKASTGHWPGVGRFHFEVYIDGKREKPATADDLPLLELIDAIPAIEPETPWKKKVGPKSSRQNRNRS